MRCLTLGVLLVLLIGCGKQKEKETLPLEESFDFRRYSEIPDLKLVNDSKVDLWGVEKFIDYSRLWILGERSNIRHVLVALHGNDASDFADDTKKDREQMDTFLKKIGEGAILIHPVSKEDKWVPFYNDSVQNSIGFLKAFRQLEKAVGASLKYQQFSHSGAGRVDRGFLKMLLERYSNDNTDLNIKEFIDNAVKGFHSGESTYNFAGDEIEIRIKFIEKFPVIKASFITDGTGSEPEEMKKIGKHFAGNSFDINKEQELLNGQLRFWKGKNHMSCWMGQFARAFGFK